MPTTNEIKQALVIHTCCHFKVIRQNVLDDFNPSRRNMSKNNKKSLLSDKIANILSTTPGNIDPEDDIYEETKAKVAETFESDESNEIQSSKFRKQNVNLLEDDDKKYSGKRSSRKDLKDSDEEDWETEDEGLSTDEGEDLDGIPGTQQYASEEEDSIEAESDGGDESADDYGDDENFKHMSDSNLPIQQKKGNAVRNQLNVWENLLEMRIQLQKCLLTSNKLPQHDTFKELSMGSDYKSAVKVTQRNVSNMLEKFLLLQNVLLKQYGETKSLLKEKNETTEKDESDEEIPSDTEEEKSESEESENDDVPRKRRKLTEFESEIKSRNEKYKTYRNSVIQKWNDKTRLAVSKSNTASNSVLQQIEYILSDKNKLVRKTQLKRSEFEVVGKSKVAEKTKDENREPEEYDTEIYDDTDFYHQLLRELIEVKSGDITDPVQMSRQWIALQNLRSKMKRKIDTKATKGRKIRYVVHSKLVNFMAPMNESSWTEEAKNELYSSLFSSNKKSN